MSKEFHNAFPFVAPKTVDSETGHLTGVDIWPGMSLRDWFAGQALGYLGQRKDVSIRDAAHIATISYELADAMLAARKGGA